MTQEDRIKIKRETDSLSLSLVTSCPTFIIFCPFRLFILLLFTYREQRRQGTSRPRRNIRKLNFSLVLLYLCFC